MKKTLLILLAFFLSIKAEADYFPLRLYDMILNADKICWGSIEKLDSTFFYVADNSSSKHQLIKVKRFKNWTCASRYANYKVGQKVILFLQNEKKHFSIMSAGGEGEIPIINDSVSIKFRCFSFPENWRDKQYQLIKDSISRFHFLLETNFWSKVKITSVELINTISEIRKKYTWQRILHLTCDDLMNNCNSNLIPNTSDSTFLIFVLIGLFADRVSICNYQYDEFGNKIR